MKYKLLVLDIDGTLLNDEHELTKRTYSALIKAQHVGVRIVIASGRPTCGVTPLVEKLELNNFGGYFLSYNGAKIYEAKDEKLLFEKVVDKEMLPYLLRIVKKNNLDVFTYNRNTIVTDSPDNKYIKHEAELNKMKLITSTDFVEDIDFAVHKLTLVGEDAGALDAIAKHQKKRLSGSISVIRSEPYFLEFAPQNIDKANALSILMDKIGVHKSEVMVIGNGIADITMIQLGGLGIAMGNAPDAVKICAGQGTSSNNEDGVAVAVEKYILSDELPSTVILKQLNANTPHSLVGNLGIEYTYASPERIEAIMPVDERNRQPFGILHGGASLALAETIAGVGSMLICQPDEIVVGMQVSGNHVSSAREGDTVRAIATIIHKGRSSHVWNVDILTSTDKLVSSVRVINSVLKKH